MNDRKIIYLRHGKDVVDNYKYDEILTDKGKIAVKEFTKTLIDEHGFPDIIYYSPYYRTRQTKNIMLKVIHKDYNQEYPEIKCDYRLSRYFVGKQKRNPDIRRDTRKRGAPIDETWKQFKQRVIEHLNEMKSNNYNVIWCVTHTLVLDCLIKDQNIDHEYDIPYLDKIIINKEDNLL